jgi:hypothetical protein
MKHREQPMSSADPPSVETDLAAPIRWNSACHPISDIRDWSDNNQLELRPDFQRREVWSDAARGSTDGYDSS